MTTPLSEALQRLRDLVRVSAGDLSEPVDPRYALKPLFTWVAEMERSDRLGRLPTESLVAAAAAAWHRSNKDLTVLSDRHVRALCAAPKIATDSAFVAGMVLHPSLSRRRQWIERLIESYVAEWRGMSSAIDLEALLRDVVVPIRRSKPEDREVLLGRILAVFAGSGGGARTASRR